MKEYIQEAFHGERSLFASSGVIIRDCVFEGGESPLKESKNVELEGSMFRYKYPLWYCKNVKANGCTWFEMARAGVWYTDHIEVNDAIIEAPKNFRRCDQVTLKNVTFTNAAETLWHCKGVTMDHVSVKGDYFAMNCTDISADHLTLDGNYAFDGAKNITIRNSRMLTKDAFWNSKNVTVYDSFISGEYLGWNSENLTLINCTIESLQGMCYIDHLKLVNCKLVNTTLAFEYADVDAEITSPVDSVFNPKSGTIKAPLIKELIIEKDLIDPAKTKIVCDAVNLQSDLPEWKRG